MSVGGGATHSRMASQEIETESVDHEEFVPVSVTVDEFDAHKKLLRSLREAAAENAEHFCRRPNLHQSNEKFYALFMNIVTSAESTELLCKPVIERVAEFDFDSCVHANGFRSLLHMVDSVVKALILQSKSCKDNRSKTFFSSSTTFDHLSSLSKALKGLSRIVLLAHELMLHLEGGELFPKDETISHSLLEQSQQIPRECFYGKCLGVHYVPSIKPVVQSIAFAMASFGEGFLRHQSNCQDMTGFSNMVRVAMSSMWHGTGFVLNHSRRASQIVSLTQSRDIHFTKSFWSLAEVSALQHMAELVIPSMAVAQQITLPIDIVYLPCCASEHGETTCKGSFAHLIDPSQAQRQHGADENATPPCEIMEEEMESLLVSADVAAALSCAVSNGEAGIGIETGLGCASSSPSSQREESVNEELQYDENYEVIEDDTGSTQCDGVASPPHYEDLYGSAPTEPVAACTEQPSPGLTDSEETTSLSPACASSSLESNGQHSVAVSSSGAPATAPAQSEPAEVNSGDATEVQDQPCSTSGDTTPATAVQDQPCSVSGDTTPAAAVHDHPCTVPGDVNTSATPTTTGMPAQSLDQRETVTTGEATAAESTTVPSVSECLTCMVAISPPLMHSSQPASVNIHLISAVYREGQKVRSSSLSFKRNSKEPAPSARGLVIHCHGGGFVATTTKSHQSYLRQWSIDLDVPVVSIDYSLAPEHPFPRALCDILFAYAWIVENCKLLGTTGEKIIITGDSAGGNLAVAMTLAAIELGIQKPDAIMAAYTPFLVELSISPSRLLSVFDPLLPQGVLLACLDAYARSDDETFTSSDSSAQQSQRPNGLVIDEESTTVSFSSSSSSLSPSSSTTFSSSSFLSSSFGWNAGGGLSVQWSKLKASLSSEAGSGAAVAGTGSEEPGSDTDVPSACEPRQSASVGTESTDSSETSLTNSEFVEVSFSDANTAGKRISSQRCGKLENLFRTQPNTYLSPLRASDELLKQLPHVDLVACALDPLLDDSIAFARRLAKLNVSSQLHVADSLPHGFLNLAFVSKEARRAYDMCTQCMRNALATEEAT
ncbi:hormone-sensitive lipase-like [Sycon ciliatum]|uniref:hormone-sensitive lipase-like n=1 Tax=Sycon ciliatum TaxID=27933 RepID=UPI0031F6AD24